MDRAYEGNVTRQLAADLGYWPVAPPRQQRKVKGDYDQDLYRQRDAVERLFGRLKRFRRIFPATTSWILCIWVCLAGVYL